MRVTRSQTNSLPKPIEKYVDLPQEPARPNSQGKLQMKFIQKSLMSYTSQLDEDIQLEKLLRCILTMCGV